MSLLSMLCVAVTLQAQYKVAITIDDMPKPKHFGGGAFATELIDVLDSLQIPVAIFINEGNIHKGNGEAEGRRLLERWIGAPYTTVGNHSYSHYACSDVPADAFLADVKKGEAITRPLAARYHKELNYFRFPYNNLGKDSAHQALIAKGMEAMGYTLVPFTVESEDWMYNYVYEYYLDRKQPDSAQLIADRYIAKTLWAFEHYEGLSQLLYREPMQHIYLCHDNVLNAYCMSALLAALSRKGYSFVSLDEALSDKRYRQASVYYDRGGISWMYRWFDFNTDKRYEQLGAEPNDGVWKIYKRIAKE